MSLVDSEYFESRVHDGSMRKLRVAAVGVCAGGLILGMAALPSSVAAPERDLQQVRSQVRDLQMSAAAAAERAGDAQARLSAISAKLRSTLRRADREFAQYRKAADTVENLARSAYINGGLDPTIEILMADDPSAFLNQAAVVAQLEQQQITQMRRAKTTGLRVAQTQAQITDQEAAATVARDQMAAAKAESDARLADAQAVLDSLEEAERQRLARLEEDKRERDLAAARALQAALAAQDGPSNDVPGDSGEFAGGTRGETAVKYALSQVGDRYSYSADPPSTWDCSKLTTAAWGQAGVGLTPLSYTQWDETKRVPLSDIRPGDLVFYFGSGAHHVAIYIGGGKMVSASNPSDGVEITDFLGPWYRERFSGVGRVM